MMKRMFSAFILLAILLAAHAALAAPTAPNENNSAEAAPPSPSDTYKIYPSADLLAEISPADGWDKLGHDKFAKPAIGGMAEMIAYELLTSESSDKLNDMITITMSEIKAVDSGAEFSDVTDTKVAGKYDAKEYTWTGGGVKHREVFLAPQKYVYRISCAADELAFDSAGGDIQKIIDSLVFPIGA